nr:hypothetical protein [Kibdelosporangium sp. MJ126-NF4]CEL14259.1 hypothetical protein [Kibdelosporangium sp. MJ126-NF4]CTQ88626.1 hypothetical protein [Kibdelosporangium sp. MJ126-NF4]
MPAVVLPLSRSGALWRGAVVGTLVLVAQVAFALPAALAGEDTHTRPLRALFAMFVGVPVSGLLLGGLAAWLLGLAKPVVVSLAGLTLTVALAALSVRLGVPHVPTTVDPGVLAYGAAFAPLGYAAAALAASPRETVGPPGRCTAIGLAVVVAIAGSLGWLAIARSSREAALAATGVPMVLADIPGHRLESVELTGENPPLVLRYVPVDRGSVLVTVSVRRADRQPRTCEDARAFFHGDQNSHTCQEIDGRWVFDDRDSQFGLVIAVHDNAVVAFVGRVADLTEARLRTASSRDLAAAPPGRQ